MGMMTRRNVKQRAVAKTALVNTEQVKEKKIFDEFAENLAKEFNHYWQDLTEQERTQIAEILRR